jgi:large conductance mechanosensitive channel
LRTVLRLARGRNGRLAGAACPRARHSLPSLRCTVKERTVSIASEFKEFAVKGNVVDLAVGVIIGAAFGKIVSSLVGDVFMPALGKLIGGVNFSDLAISLGKDPTGKDVLIRYGAFVQTTFDFLIVALVLFVAIKGINRLKKPRVSDGPPPPRSEVLLEEIRNLLAKRA